MSTTKFSILKKAELTQAFLKCNIYGFAGTGKSYSAKELALGLAKHIESQKSVAWFDTETGSDYFIPEFEAQGIELLQAKTRAFSDLLNGLNEAIGNCDIVIVDSVTHYWRELQETYLRRKIVNRLLKKYKTQSESELSDKGFDRFHSELKSTLMRERLAFQDWNYLKNEWAKFTDIFVNAPIHMIVCGRAGHDWDYFQDDAGKYELRKTGTKMKAEGEFSFEPSLVYECERLRKSEYNEDPKAKGFLHTITILKDRWNKINGETFIFDPEKPIEDGISPVFKSLLPHIELLNIGGIHSGYDNKRKSDDMIPNGITEYRQIQIIRDQILEEFDGIITENLPGQTAAEKKLKIEIAKIAFGTRSRTAIENLPINKLRAGCRKVVEVINGMRLENNQQPIEIPAIFDDKVEEAGNG
jgi:hypothetical protein